MTMLLATQAVYFTALAFLVATTRGDALSGCSAATQCPIQNTAEESLCVMVGGLGDRDFAGNGLYFFREETNGTYTSIEHNKLRYEFRSQDKLKWKLFRVTTTKRGWVELPIYEGVALHEVHLTQLQDLKWSALSLEDSDLIDTTEPAIDVSVVNVTSAFIQSLHVLERFRSDSIDACELSVCDTMLSQKLLNETNSESCYAGAFLSASLANEVSNSKLAAERLEQARACIQFSNQGLIPRSRRWKIADTSYQMARSFVQAGMLQAAIDATLVGLSHSPHQWQRRLLYATLGDLRLAAKETKAAYSAYVHALKAVRQKGGAVETNNFLQSFLDSVGDFIGQVVNNISHSSGLALAIPDNYSEVRINLILHAEKDDVYGTWDVDDLETASSLLDPLTSFGRECEMGETSFEFCHSVVTDQANNLLIGQ